MSDMNVRVVLEAEDRARQTVSGTNAEIAASMDRLRQSIDNLNASMGNTRRRQDEATDSNMKFGRGLRETQQAVNAMSNEVVSRLNPALAGAIGALGGAASAARNMPVALGAATVAIAAASAALGIFIDRMKEAQDFQVKFNVAVRNADIGGLRTSLTAQNETLERFRVLSQQAGQEITGFSSALQVMVAFWQRWAAGGEEAVDRVNKRIRELKREMAPLMLMEAGIEATGVSAQRQGILRGEALTRAGVASEQGLSMGVFNRHISEAVRRVNTQEMDELGVLAGRRTQQRTLIQQGLAAPESITPIEMQMENVRIAARLQREALERRRVEEGRRRFEAGQNVGMEQFVGFEAAWFGGGASIGGMTATDRAAVADIEEKRHLAGVKALEAAVKRDALEVGAFGEMIGAGVTPEDENRIFEQRVRMSREALGLERERQMVLAEIAGLSAREADAMALSVIEAERLLEVQEARGDGRREDLANIRASVRRGNVIRAGRERDDPIAGLVAGFREAEEDFGAAGRRMERIAHATASNMSQAFSDSFFSVVTGDFKKLPEIATQFGAQMLKAFTDELGKMTAKPVLGWLRGLFSGTSPAQPSPPGGFNVGALPGAGAPTTNAPATGTPGIAAVGAGRLVGQGSGYTVDAGGLTQGFNAAGVPLQAPGYTPVSGLGDYYATDVDYGPTTFAAMQGGTDAGAGTAGSAGASWQSYGTGALAVAGAALALYGVYESSSAGARKNAVQEGVMSGAMVGAMAGLALAPATMGLSIVVGAILGGVIGGFGGAESEARYTKLKRRAQRREQADDVVGQITAALNSDTDSMASMLSRRLRFRIQAVSWIPAVEADGPTIGGVLRGLAARGHAALDALLAGLGIVAEEIDIEHTLIPMGTTGRGWINSLSELAASIGDLGGFLESVYQRLLAIQQIEGAIAAAPFGFETDAGYGVRRVSQLVVGHLDRGYVGRGTQDLFYSSEVLRQRGFDDVQIDRVLQRLKSYTRRSDQPITDYTITRFLDA